MAHFLCKLLPVRRSFPAGMTPAEAALMQAPMSYWASLAASGVAVVVGPVADPAGFWGLAIIEAEDDAAGNLILADDPVTAAGSGFRYETYPMPQAILRSSRPDGRLPAQS